MKTMLNAIKRLNSANEVEIDHNNDKSSLDILCEENLCIKYTNNTFRGAMIGIFLEEYDLQLNKDRKELSNTHRRCLIASVFSKVN